MRHILIAAAALAACGSVASTSAIAQGEPPYEAGGPLQIAGWCLVDTSADLGSTYGYYQPCGQQARAQAWHRRHRSY
jgi:hypothetical protein